MQNSNFAPIHVFIEELEIGDCAQVLLFVFTRDLELFESIMLSPPGLKLLERGEEIIERQYIHEESEQQTWIRNGTVAVFVGDFHGNFQLCVAQVMSHVVAK